MPAYNAEAYIAEAIESVIKQEFARWELCVINDGSTDGTLSVIQRYTADPRIKLSSQQNQGLGAARNAGIASATANWICFLDADDAWLHNKLKVQHAFILQHPEVDMLFSDGYIFDQSIEFRLPYHFNVAKGLYTGAEMYTVEFAANSIPVLSACIKKDWCDKAGGFDEDTKGAEDWDYWLRLALAGATFYGMSERLFVYRVHNDSMSAMTLNQHTASALILIKNYRQGLLHDDIVKSFMLDLIKLHRQLTKAGRNTEAKLISSFVDQNYDAKKFRHLKNTSPSGSTAKSFAKRLFLAGAKLFFRPYAAYQKHAHNLTLQYYRWELGSRLEIRGGFYISPKAKLDLSEGSKLITNGMHIKDFSQISLAATSSYMICGNGVVINRFCNFLVWEGRLMIGSNVSFNNYCSVNCMEQVEIGDDTWFGEGVRIYDHNHNYKTPGVPFTKQGMTTGKVKIGDNCWIGSNTVILQNVTIGDNCVIGANNLIYKSVPPNTIVKASAMEMMTPVNDETTGSSNHPGL